MQKKEVINYLEDRIMEIIQSEQQTERQILPRTPSASWSTAPSALLQPDCHLVFPLPVCSALADLMAHLCVFQASSMLLTE